MSAGAWGSYRVCSFGLGVDHEREGNPLGVEQDGEASNSQACSVVFGGLRVTWSEEVLPFNQVNSDLDWTG